MGRTKGTYTLTSNIEPKVGAPLDARTVVPLKTDLTANGTFDYPYIGLSVFVREDNKRYTLIGADPTVEANWREEGSGTSTSADHVTYDNRESGLESVNIQDAVDEIVDDLGSAAYKDVPTSGNADDTQVVMGSDSRLTDSRPANDVYPWAKSVNKPSYTYSEIQNTPTLGTAAAKDYTNSVTEDSTDLVTSGAVYDALESLPSDDTWRNIKVNGTEKLGTANNTGAVDFINGTNTTVSFDSSGNKIKIDAVDTKYTFVDGTNGFTVTPSSGGTAQNVKVTPSIDEATTSAAGLMSAADKTKLNGIATGAEVNVQSDWNQTTTTADDYIKNKPTIPPAVAVKGNSETVYRTGNVNITKGNIGLGNVDNTSDATKKTNFTGSIASGNTGFVTGGDAYTALNGKLNTSLKGVANGLAELDADGKVPSSQLPSYVDDVIEVADYAHLPITGESGKIYVTLDINLTYRWSGTGYTEISASLALGETSSTAYRGDRGKTAYDHATETKLSTATASGLYKVASTAQGHIASLTAVQKSDITALGIPGSDTNTTYTFEGGTNSFKVTPSGASAQTVTVTPSIANATTSASGLMSASDKTKLNGIATGAEVNQNAFSNVKVGSTTVAADAKTDTLELVAGSNVSLTPDTTNDKITIAATDTTYTFTGGTNKFTVTPSGASAQDVAITVNDSTKLPLAGGTLTGRVTTTKALNDIITGTGTAAQDRGSGNDRYVPAKWTFNTGLTATNGDIVVVKVPVDGHDYGTYMSIDNGTTYYAVNSINTTRLTTQYPTGNYVALIFDSNATTSMYPLNGGTSRSNVTGAWRVFNNYDSGNTDTYNRNRYQAAIKADADGIAVNNIAVGNSSGIFSQLNKGLPFDIDQPILFVERAIAANGTDTKNYDITALAITTTQNITLTAYLPVYIKGTLSGKTFTPVSTTPLTQTIPSSEDGYYYMLLGRAYSTTQIYLQEVHPVFKYIAAGTNAFIEVVNDAYAYRHVSGWNFTTTRPWGQYVTFDQSNPTGGPGSFWVNGFVSSHNNYLASYILNKHRTADWYVGYGEYNASTGTSPAPTWYLLLHSGNYDSYAAKKTEAIKNITRSGTTFTATRTDDTTFTFTQQDNNTTYTFAGGTNGFTVTPSGGSAQTVTVTPSIANNITGSGTSGYIAKFNGTNTITNGPAFGSATTTYLRNDGTWATPTDTNTHRPIQMNGTEILGNNTTALNLKAGSNVTLTNSSGTVTIAATNTLNTAGSTDTSSKIFLIGATSQAANPQTYSDDQVYTTSGTLQTNITKATTIVNANSGGSGTAGGLALYSDANPEVYGVMFRTTANSGKHGYVQSDWATYFTMNSGATTRGWVYRLNQTGNVASISGAGNAVFNGSVTVGGNSANTSGGRMEYNATNHCIDFIVT